MVPNPIYDGPVYEKVQPQFEALTKTSLLAASVTNASDSSPALLNDASVNTVRYVDDSTRLTDLRSKSFHMHLAHARDIMNFIS